MVLHTTALAVHAGAAHTGLAMGLAWPPIQPVAIGAPVGTDPTGLYPLLDPIISTELISADDPDESPENRVARYIESRTETLRALLNKLESLSNLLPFYFLDRDGDANTIPDPTDPTLPPLPSPSYMRRNFDMGSQRITDLLDGSASTDVVTFEQLQAVQFAGEDNVEQILDTEIVRVDGTIPMAADLNMEDTLSMIRFRIVTLGTPTVATHMMTKGALDTQITFIQANFLNRIGNQAMTGGLSFQDLVTSPRFRPVNVGLPTQPGDLVNKFYADAQFDLIGGNDVPVGMLLPFFGAPSGIPVNFLLCDGREVSRNLYQNLFLTIGTAYGSPSNVNVFKLPDMRGRVALGKDNMNGTSANIVTDPLADQLGGKFGEEKHVLLTAEMAAHSHTYDDAYEADGLAGALPGAITTDSDNTLTDAPGVSGLTGGGLSHNNLQPSQATNWIVRY